MKKTFKRCLSCVIAFSLLLLMQSLPVYAVEIPNSVQESTSPKAIDSKDLFISCDLAKDIALLFVADMIATGSTDWTSSTCVLNVTAMYDGSMERNVVAYTVELNNGYVVVSAYVDVPNIILEWSDKAAPLYKQLSLSKNDEVVYGGSLYYYKDDGSGKLQTLGDFLVERDEVINVIEDMRDASNIPASFMTALTDAKECKTASGKSSTPGSSNVITNPFTHASTWYNGPYVANDWQNHWESNGSTIECHSTSEFSNLGNGYVNHCGPTAITNMLIIYGNRFGTSSINNKTDDNIFLTVARIGTSNLYYVNTNALGLGGTANFSANSYILDSFDAFNVSGITVNGRYNLNYTNVEISLRNDRLLYLLLDDHDCYGDHHVVCYAYTRLVSSTDSSYATYLKVADGWASSPRYIDMASVAGDKYWEVSY